MCVADDPLAIDDEHAAARETEGAERAVQGGDRLVGVGQQRELQPVLAGERLVAVDALCRYCQYLSIERFELIEAAVVRVELLRAHGRVVTRIEDQDDGLADEVFERNHRPTRRGQTKRRCRIADAHVHASTASIRSSLMSKLL